MEDLLPVLDSFDMAMENKEAWEKVDANWRRGVEHIHQQFLRVLSDNNVSAINQSGVKFDPNLHESISVIETDDKDQDHTIYSVTQSGYKIGDRVIRPARVNVFEYKK
jgi:molecular chaperone GrpE